MSLFGITGQVSVICLSCVNCLMSVTVCLDIMNSLDILELNEPITRAPGHRTRRVWPNSCVQFDNQEPTMAVCTPVPRTPYYIV